MKFTADQRAELIAAAEQSRVEAEIESLARRTGHDVLLLPEAQPIILRIDAATDSDYPHRDEHISRVATVVLQAKRHPLNKYAKPTLPTPTTNAPQGEQSDAGCPAEQTGASIDV